MTEILDSGDPGEREVRRGPHEPALVPAAAIGPPTGSPPAPARDAAGAAGADGVVEWLDDGRDGETEPVTGGRFRVALGALGEPGSLAVAASFAALMAAVAGPSYRFDAYPFNQGISSIQTFVSNTLIVHPLHDYLTASAANIVLGLAGILAGLTALLRGRPDQPGWVRPLAAGALLASVLVLALLTLGAYRTSTYDLIRA